MRSTKLIVILVIGLAVGLTAYAYRERPPEAQTSAAPTASGNPSDPLARTLIDNPQDAAAWVALGHSYYDQGRHAEAILAYRQALALKPATADLLVDVGTSYFYIGQSGQALDYIDQALAQSPKHLNGLINRGIILNHQGKKAEAKAAWETALPLAQEPDLKKALEARLKNL